MAGALTGVSPPRSGLLGPHRHAGNRGGGPRLAQRFSGASTEVGEGFNPEVGFLARVGYRKADFFVLRAIRPERLWGLQELRPDLRGGG